MKKFVMVLLVVSLFLSCVSTGGGKVENFIYQIKGQGENLSITITGYKGRIREMIIPDMINGLPVTAIGDYAFGGSNLISVTIPASVSVIGEYAFAYNKLTNVTIPEGVTVIGDRAFSDNPLVVSNMKIPEHLHSRIKAIFDSIFDRSVSARYIAVIVEDYFQQGKLHQDNSDYEKAIASYREVLKLSSSHTGARNNLQIAWDRRIAANRNIYPTPFEGRRKHYTPATAGIPPKYGHSSPGSRTLHYSGKDHVERWSGGEYLISPGTPGSPAVTIIIEFKGNSYTMSGTSGTFFYRGDRIELDDGHILSFINGKLLLSGRVFDRL